MRGIMGLFLCLALLTSSAAFADEMLYPEGVKRYNAALALQRAGETDKALAAYNTAVMLLGKLSPYMKYIFNNSAVMHAEKGDLRKAEVFFQRALEIDPKYRNAGVNLGLLYLRQGQLTKAIKIWTALFDLPTRFTLEPEQTAEQKTPF